MRKNLLVLIALLAVGCATAEPLDPEAFPPEDAGAVDAPTQPSEACAACWSDCGMADSRAQATLCAHACGLLCEARD